MFGLSSNIVNDNAVVCINIADGSVCLGGQFCFVPEATDNRRVICACLVLRLSASCSIACHEHIVDYPSISLFAKFSSIDCFISSAFFVLLSNGGAYYEFFFV